jgi:hypothetical protein
VNSATMIQMDVELFTMECNGVHYSQMECNSTYIIERSVFFFPFCLAKLAKSRK